MFSKITNPFFLLLTFHSFIGLWGEFSFRGFSFSDCFGRLSSELNGYGGLFSAGRVFFYYFYFILQLFLIFSMISISAFFDDISNGGSNGSLTISIVILE